MPATFLVGFNTLEIGAALSTAPARRPNIVLILTDDHAAHALSCYGSAVNLTPELDRIADEGVRFDEAACTNALCAPSRATILTGTHSHVNGMSTLTTSFDSGQPTFPALLQQAGYRTALFGKWHLGHGDGHDPQGFDTWQILDGQGDYYDPVLIDADGPHQHTGYVTDLLTDLALDWIDSQPDDDRPWCVLLWHKAPHRRWFPGPQEQDLFTDDLPVPSTYFDDYQNRASAAAEAEIRVARDLDDLDFKHERPPAGLDDDAYAHWAYQKYMKDYLRCIAGVDRNTGRLLRYLDAHQLTDDTLISYASDQGFFLGDHGWFDKRFMYRESHRLPLMMRYPREIPAGLVRDELVLNLDLAQTFLDFAGVEAPERMQGASMRPLTVDEEPSQWRDHTYYRYWEHLKAGVGAHCGVRTRQYKLIHYYGEALGTTGAIDSSREPEWELFDLTRDVAEMHNVYDVAEYAAIREQLTAQLYRAAAGAGDQLPPSLR